MKKIKFLFTLMLAILLIPSCENNGGDSAIALQTGAVPNIIKISSTDSFIDLVAVQNGETIELGFTVQVGQGEVQSMDIILYYTSGSNTYKATLESNITTFPKEFNLSQTDLINLFPQINATSDFKLGDQLVVSALLTLKNGNKVNILNDDASPNYGQDIANSTIYKVFQSYAVSCPSALEGVYSVVSSGASTDSGPTASENPISNYPYTVTITANGGGKYTMSDGYAGLYLLWYDIYGISGEYPGTFTDVCGTISGTYTEPFGSDVTVSGTVNNDETLTIRWENGYGDFGIGVYTKQ